MEALRVKLTDLPYFSEEEEKTITPASAEKLLRQHLGTFQNVKDIEVIGDTATIYFEGVSDEDLLRSKSTASVLYLLDTLERFRVLSLETIREIAFEIGLLAQHGIDFESSNQRYNLRNLPNERFSALQLMALMYAGFKVFEPSLDIGIDLHNEFNVAKELYDASK